MSRPARYSPDRWTVLLLWSAVGFCILFILRSVVIVDGTWVFCLFDDAMISMRYARHLSEGHGLVWNPGEVPPIEGYSNFLWTLCMALFHRLGLPDTWVSLPVMLAGTGLLAGTAWNVGRITRTLTDDPWMVPLVVGLTAWYFPLMFWTLRGMEVGLLAYLISGAVYLVYRLEEDYTRRRMGLLTLTTIALLLTRSDALLPVLVITAYLGLVLSGRPRREVLGMLVGGTLLTVGLHTYWRWTYYGELVPNTYYLKLTGVSMGTRLNRGLKTITALFFRHGYALILPVLGLFIFRIGQRRYDHRWFLPVVLLVVQGAYSIYVGGDVWEGLGFANRYLTPVIPVFMVLVGMGLAYVIKDTRRLRWLVGGLMLLTGLRLVLEWGLITRNLTTESALIDWLRDHAVLTAGIGVLGVFVALSTGFLVRWWRHRAWTPTSFNKGLVGFGLVLWGLVNAHGVLDWVGFNAYQHDDHKTWLQMARHIQQYSTEEATIAVFAAGTISYFSHRPAVDLLGKVDPVIARMTEPALSQFLPGHNKWDYTYSIGVLRPDVVAHLLRPRPADRQYLATQGYRSCSNGMWVLEASPYVDQVMLCVPIAE